MKTGAAVALGVVGLAAVGAVVLAATSSSSSKAPPSPAPTGASFNQNTAIPVPLGGSITVPIGSSIMLANPPGGALWQSPGVTTSSAVILAPSVPATVAGFVAASIGQATLTGSYVDASGQSVTSSASVSVVAQNAGAVGAAGPGGTSIPPPAAAAAAPAGLTSSAPTSTGWAMAIDIGGIQGVSYECFLGDRVSLTLPAGAHWSTTAAGGEASLAPGSGTEPLEFTYVAPISVQVTWTDHLGANQVSVCDFQTGGSFQQTSRLSTNDYVILALGAADYTAVAASLTAWQAQGAQVTDEERQQVATIEAGALAVANAGANLSPENILEFLFASGPWGEAFAPDVRAFMPMRPGSAIPSWWPADDTAAASEYHVIYRYVGPGVDVSALPFPVTAWKRVQ